MKKIIAMVLSVLMSILSALGISIPGLVDPANCVKQGEWLTMVVTEFGYSKQDVEVPYKDVPAEYLEVVKTAYAFEVIVDADEIDCDAYATNAFVSATLTRATEGVEVELNIPDNNKKAVKADAVAALTAAVEAKNNQKMPEAPTSAVVPQAGVADLSAVAYDVIAEGKLAYAAKDFALKAGDKFIAAANETNLSGAAYEVLAVTVVDGVAIVDVASVAVDEAIETIDFEGSVDADLDEAVAYDNNGALIEKDLTVEGQGLKDEAGKLVDKAKDAATDFLKNPKISFSVKGFKVKAAYSGGRVDVSVAGNVVDNVRVEKYYSLDNIKFDTKYDANLAKLQIKEAYLKMNYDLVETTVLQGSYAASVVPEGGSFTNEGANFLEKVKANLGNLKLQEGSGIKVNLFTFDIPIAQTGLTVEMNVSLTLSATGRIEIIVTSNETKGYEIINNKGRVIHDSTVYSRQYNISGDFRAVLGLDLSLTFLGYKIVDVEFSGGIGAYVLTQIYNTKTGKATTTEIPMDIAIEAAAGSDDVADLRFCADVELYGILSVSVGKNSVINKIGLSKAWTFYDRSNGVFANLHIENSGIVDSCTYAAA